MSQQCDYTAVLLYNYCNYDYGDDSDYDNDCNYDGDDCHLDDNSDSDYNYDYNGFGYNDY